MTRLPTAPSCSGLLTALATLACLGCLAPAALAAPCDTSQSTPGCDDPAVEACVCAFDSYCCSTKWDGICVSEAESDCSGAPCTVPTPEPGCADPAVEACVCALEPFCCDAEWDSGCVQIANMACDAPIEIQLPDPGFIYIDPWCGTVTSAVCTDEAFLDTGCGATLLDQVAADPNHICHAAVQAAAEAATAEIADGQTPVSVLRVAVTDSAGNTSSPSSPTQTVDAYRETSEGDDAGVVAKAFWMPATTVFGAFQRSLFNQNGGKVASCSEYAYEKYYDISRFEDAMDQAGDDYRSIFQTAYGHWWLRTSVATRVMKYGALYRKVGGQVDAPVLATAPQPKNAFFDLPPMVRLSLEVDFDKASDGKTSSKTTKTSSKSTKTAFDTSAFGAFQFELIPVWTWLDKLIDQPELQDFEWHAKKAVILADQGIIDEELAFYEHKQEQFRQLVTLAETALVELNNALQTCAFVAEDEQFVDLEEQLINPLLVFQSNVVGTCSMDQLVGRFDTARARMNAVEWALRDAHTLGCLNANTAHCDWSPKMFVEAARALPHAERHADYTACVEASNGDFSQLAWYQFPGYEPNDPPIVAWASYDDDTVEVDAFIDNFDAWVIGFIDWFADQGFVGEDGKPRLGKSYTSAAAAGNEWFGVDYGLHFAWEIQNVGEDDQCEVDLRFDGGFDATASVLTADLELAHVDVEIQGVDEGHFTLTLLGEEIFDPEWFDDSADAQGVDTTWNIVGGAWEEGQTQQLASTTFTVAGVPVRIGAGVSGQIGLDHSVDLAFDQSCDDFGIHLTGHFEPRAKLDGYATLSVDYGIAEAGIKGQVNIIHASLPTHTDLAVVAPDGDLSQLALTMESDANLVLRTLDGRVAVFAELLWSTWEKTIFTWSGLREDIELFDLDYELPLHILRSACGRGLFCPTEGS